MQSHAVSGVLPVALFLPFLSQEFNPSPLLPSLYSCFFPFAFLACLLIFITSLAFYSAPPARPRSRGFWVKTNVVFLFPVLAVSGGPGAAGAARSDAWVVHSQGFYIYEYRRVCVSGPGPDWLL